MAEMEEPPSKVTKFESDGQYLEGEVLDESQEEWLSEGILTDDDYNPANQQAELDHSDPNLMNQDQTTTSLDSNSQDMLDPSSHFLHQTQEMLSESAELNACQELNGTEMEDSAELHHDAAADIEETLNSLENSQNNSQTQDLPEELETFLIRKPDPKANQTESKAQADQTVKQSDDDGNDTDDLLRVLGDGDQKYKDHAKKEKDAESSDDDEYIFQGAKMKNYELAKNVLMRGTAAKAEPEEDECSSDEATLKKMFGVNNKTTKTTNVVKTGNTGKSVVYKQNQGEQHSILKKKVINVVHRPKTAQSNRPAQPLKQYENKSLLYNSLLKAKTEPKDVKPKVETLKQEHVEEETAETNKKSAPKETGNKPAQRLMKPEEMDEEVPTDAESEDDDDEESIYDELPSSDSDSHEDWFTLDIRAERAGDYIPLLGDKAFQLLSEEKERVAARLNTLKKSLSALTQSGKEQAEKLREATSTVAELDAMLKAV